ncbi:MAG: hypothetical protein L0Y77_05265 [Chlorobi bacterium]|nr:hypothetical protein [Chlorobiota bacterium]
MLIWGPFVVYLDLTQKVVIAAIAKVPLGNYDEIMLQVHKPSPNENIPDPEFNEGPSNHQRFSVIVRGLYNNIPFVYRSSITAARGIEFENPPVTAVADAVVNITISLNPYSWFITNSEILDPTNPDNENIIDHRIKDSFKRAFKDMDLNGEPD